MQGLVPSDCVTRKGMSLISMISVRVVLQGLRNYFLLSFFLPTSCIYMSVELYLMRSHGFSFKVSGQVMCGW